MRLGLIGDVHTNLFALRAAVSRLRTEGADARVCLGDLIGRTRLFRLASAGRR